MRLITEFDGVIEYKEMKGSPRESYVGHQGKVQRRFLVEWPKRWKFCRNFLGYSYVPSGNNYISRIPPEPYVATAHLADPFGFDQHWLFAADVEEMVGMEPDGRLFPMQDYDDTPYVHAAITIGYESLTYKAVDDSYMRDKGYTHDETITGYPRDFFGDYPRRYITKISQPTAEYLKTPFGAFFFIRDQVTGNPPIKWMPAALGQGKIVCSRELIYVWHQFPSYLSTAGDDRTRVYYPTAASNYLGTVNNATVDGHKLGTLLYTAFEYKPYRNIGGFLCGDLTYKLKYFEPETTTSSTPVSGHNFFLRPNFETSNPTLRIPLKWSMAASRLIPPESNPSLPPTTEDENYLYNYKNFNDLFIHT